MSDIKLILGDCLEVLKDFPDNHFDLTLTSPPYDNLRTYENTCDWNFEVFTKLVSWLYRVTKQGGVIVWIVGDAVINGSETGSSFEQALYFKKFGFNIHDTMIWKKPHFSMPQKNRYHNTFEYMFIFSKGKPKTFNPIIDKVNKYANKKPFSHNSIRKKDGDMQILKNKRAISEYGKRYNVWEINSAAQEEPCKKHEHPAMFPKQLANDHIISWSNEGDLILDPMMGSGTTGLTAKKNNRNFVGIERVEKYFNIAKQRIENE